MAYQRYLIFGGTGSLGKKLIDRLLPDNEVFVYSRDEAKHFTIRNELSNHKHFKQLKFIVGDIRDLSRLTEAIKDSDPHVIIIAAALKQVETCELSPMESVATNVLGTQNVITAIRNCDHKKSSLEKVLFVSTDKSCSPVNVYGMCKAISERIVTSSAMSLLLSKKEVKFLCTRYGNVLESRGSIVPLFRYQAEFNEFLTVTDPEMTRYLMTLDDSVDLIETALHSGKSGETWVPMLPAMRIGDLADLYSEKWNKPVKLIGLRPGEKKHEDLINESESVRTTVTQSHYVIDPAFKPGNKKRFTYSSNDNVLSKQELYKHLTKLNIFDKKLNEFEGSSIEEIMTNRSK